MTTAVLDQGPDPFQPRRAKRQPAWLSWSIVGAAVVLVAAVLWLRGPTITDHDRASKTITVVLPPPPPPPPPPEPKPAEKPPEPKPMPIEQPQDTTPPPPTPQQQNTPVQGTDALTAREGAGPSNYGLQRGDGGGTRIGGTPGGGGNGFAAYASLALSDIRRAAQSDAALSRGRYSVRVLVSVNAEGRITAVRLLEGSGDARRDAAVERRLTGLMLSQRPPLGLPAMRIELNSRAGA